MGTAVESVESENAVEKPDVEMVVEKPDVQSNASSGDATGSKGATRRFGLLAIAAGALVCFCGVAGVAYRSSRSIAIGGTVTPEEEEVDRLLGGSRVKVAAGSSSSSGLEGWMNGPKFDQELIFANLEELNDGSRWNWIKTFFYKPKDVVLNIRMDNYLRDVLAGYRDGELWKLAGMIKNTSFNGRKLYLRFFHEANGNWYMWGYTANGNTKQQYKDAYNKVVNIMKKGTGYRGDIKYQMGLNCDNPNMDPSGWSDVYPGNANVDMIVCSAYNWGYSQKHYKMESFATVFRAGYYRMKTIKSNGVYVNKPLGVSETATVSGDQYYKGQWYKDMAYAMEHEFTAVTQVDLFLWDMGDGDWAIHTQDDMNGLKQALYNMP